MRRESVNRNTSPTEEVFQLPPTFYKDVVGLLYRRDVLPVGFITTTLFEAYLLDNGRLPNDIFRAVFKGLRDMVAAGALIRHDDNYFSLTEEARRTEMLSRQELSIDVLPDGEDSPTRVSDGKVATKSLRQMLGEAGIQPDRPRVPRTRHMPKQKVRGRAPRNRGNDYGGY